MNEDKLIKIWTVIDNLKHEYLYDYDGIFYLKDHGCLFFDYLSDIISTYSEKKIFTCDEYYTNIVKTLTSFNEVDNCNKVFNLLTSNKLNETTHLKYTSDNGVVNWIGYQRIINLNMKQTNDMSNGGYIMFIDKQQISKLKMISSMEIINV